MKQLLTMSGSRLGRWDRTHGHWKSFRSVSRSINSRVTCVTNDKGILLSGRAQWIGHILYTVNEQIPHGPQSVQTNAWIKSYGRPADGCPGLFVGGTGQVHGEPIRMEAPGQHHQSPPSSHRNNTSRSTQLRNEIAHDNIQTGTPTQLRNKGTHARLQSSYKFSTVTQLRPMPTAYPNTKTEAIKYKYRNEHEMLFRRPRFKTRKKKVTPAIKTPTLTNYEQTAPTVHTIPLSASSFIMGQ